MHRLSFLLCAWCAGLLVASVSTDLRAAKPVGPVIPGYDRFFKAKNADPVIAGRLLLTELNCVSCHRVADDLLRAKPAPGLTHAGSRIQVDWLKKFLDSPHTTKPGTTMPEVFAGVSDADRSDRVNKLVHFLASTGSVVVSAPDVASVRRGEQLFHRAGCVACHAPQREAAESSTRSVPLGELHDKYSLTGLALFLKDPLAVRSGGRMPGFNLDDTQARDLASYFFRSVQLPANLNYAYYEGNWEKLPDFSKLKPKHTGEAVGFNLNVAERGDQFAIRFDGFIQIPVTGTYRFYLGSDDGSRLLIDGREVANVDGVHPHQEKAGTRKLRKGPHEVRVEYFEAGGHHTLTVEIQGSGIPRQPLASIATLTEEPPPAKPGEPEPFRLDLDLAAEGQKLFASAGCASCHELQSDGQLVTSTVESPGIFDLADFEAGCLSETASAGLPRYELTRMQKEQIRTAVGGLAESPKRRPTEVIHETLARFNCYGCHQRGEHGGIEKTRSEFFETTMKEMGDEGRLPPRLDGVGDKLTADWLKHVLENGANDRPYMLARMPKFGGANAGHLLAELRKVDLKTEAEIAEEEELKTSHLKAAGRRLVGGKGLGCIKCHTFGPHAATGIQAMDLTTMSKRLRKDWWFRYMDNPQVYRPGTRMPAPWPFGNATIRDVLGANAPRQMNAVWTYLKDGPGAGIPLGLNRGAIVLEPKDEPIVYRNFIEGVSPRAIAVGYPERVNLCFDAEQFSLALLWQNDFIDASKHWIGRGPGNQRPLGDNVVSIVRGVPFAVLESRQSAWPTTAAAALGYRFRGYRFDSKRRPIFRYEFQGCGIEDAIAPVETADGQAVFARQLTLTGAGSLANLFWRAAARSRIKDEGDGRFVVDDQYSIAVGGEAAGRPILRDNAGRQELLIPIEVNEAKSSIRIRYAW